MSIRILRADGVLEVVDKIVPYAEKAGVWNGKARRKMERAAELSEANALVFCTLPKNFTVGNLSPDQLLELQREALERECVDLTTLGCEIIAKEKAVLDVKQGKPYFLGADEKAGRAEGRWLNRLERQGNPFGAFSCNNGFGGMGLMNAGMGGFGSMEDEDEEGEDDEIMG